MFDFGSRSGSGGRISNPGFHPIDNFSAHPVQGFLSFLAGMVAPGGGQIANQAFDAYNDRNFMNSANTLLGTQAQQGNAAANAAMNQPLNGPLGQWGGGNSNGGGGGGPQFGGQGYNLFDMIGNGGGMFDSLPGNGGSLFVPDYGQGPEQVPNSPMWGQGQDEDHHGSNPQERRDNGGGGWSMNQFSPGITLITGSNDPNGRYHMHRRFT